MADWKIIVRIEAYVDWMKPPASREEEILREQANNLVRSKTGQFEKELAAILESDYRGAE